jgi:Uncharacterized conserved protein (COG2071)
MCGSSATDRKPCSADVLDEIDVSRGLTPLRAPGDTSGAGVGVVIDLAETLGVDVAVDLRGRERGVAEELLDRAKVGAALEQVRGEGVAEPVGVGEQAAERGRVERPAACGDEEPVLRAANELRAPFLEIAAEAVGGLLAERDDPLLVALPAHEDVLLLPVDVREAEVDSLLSPQAGRVDELEERSVPGAERPLRLEGRQEIVDLVRTRRMGKAPPAATGEREIGHPGWPEGGSEKGTDGSNPAGDRRLGELPRPLAGAVAAEVGCVAGKRTRVEAFERQPLCAQPAGEVPEIAAVGPARAGREGLPGEKPVDRVLGLHGTPFRLAPRVPAVRLSLRVRDLLLASWPTDPELVARTLPRGLEPEPVDGRHLVTIAALRYTGGRLGPLPVPPFAQLNVRAYVRHEGKPAVFFLMTRVTPAGMGGALLGAPYRPTRLRLGPGRVNAPGLGVSITYVPGEPARASALTAHEVGLYEAAGVRAFRIRRGPAEWRLADPVGRARADPLLALGFDVSAPPELLYAATAGFEAELPPRRIRP